LEGWNEVLKWSEHYNSAQPRLFNQIQVYITNWSAKDDDFIESAEIQIAARLPPGITSSEWYAKLHELMPDVDLTPIGNPVEAFQSSKNTSLVRAFLSSIRANSGNPEFVLKSGTADYNIVGPKWKCPIVVYGPGDSQYDHTPNEQIDVEEYYRSIEVIKGVLGSLTRLESPAT
jgi:LysW-gamma-L-lysine carboxypeptidase